MEEYHKIQSLFKRDHKTKKIIEGEWTLPEFEYLANNIWQWSEKVDGCLHYTNSIYTDQGLIPIGTIVENKLPVKILSYNVEKDITEYKNIIYYHKEKRHRDFLSVSVRSKNKGNKPKYIICTDNHKFFSNGKWIQAKDLKEGQLVSHLSEKLQEETKQIILGTLLGDSSIYRPSNSTRGLSIIHSIAQNEYFEYKKLLLGNLFNERKGTIGGFAGSKKNRRGNSVVNNAISNLIINYCEVDCKKTITKKWVDRLLPIGIAFWYMDDGSANFTDKQRARIRFATNAFSYREVELLQEMFKVKYNIDSKIFDYKGSTLCLSADGSERLFCIIAPYICKSMKYKLPLKYRKCSCFLDEPINTFKGITDTEVLSISKELPKRAKNQQTFQYDLTVEDNCNYFTNSILVHNTNTRVSYKKTNVTINNKTLGKVEFGGKTANASIPATLVNKLVELFPADKFSDMPDSLTLFGEGYGKGIQKGGKYIENGVDFVLFDVKVGPWWLKREDVEDIADKLNIKVVPIIGEGTLYDIIDLVKEGFKSKWGDFIAEGIVARPKTELFARNGSRIITKLKYRDFNK